MLPAGNVCAAWRMPLITALRVALAVSKVEVWKPLARASVDMSLASNSQAFRSPLHPPYLAGSTLLSPMHSALALPVVVPPPLGVVPPPTSPGLPPLPPPTPPGGDDSFWKHPAAATANPPIPIFFRKRRRFVAMSAPFDRCA